MARVLQTPRSRRDLLDIWSFVAEDSPEAADRLLEGIDQKCKLLAQFPEMGRRREELAASLRSFSAGSCIIFYRLVEDGVEVIRVLHGARDLPSIPWERDLS